MKNIYIFDYLYWILSYRFLPYKDKTKFHTFPDFIPICTRVKGTKNISEPGGPPFSIFTLVCVSSVYPFCYDLTAANTHRLKMF